MTDEEYAAFVDRLIELSNTPPPATDAEVEAMKSVLDRLRPLEYDEYVVRIPKPTEEDMSANHAAGLPVMEKIVRCRACKWFREDWTPHDRERPYFCVLHGDDLADGYGFCSWSEPKEDA